MREFEPIFDLRSRKVVGYEVLYRGVEVVIKTFWKSAGIKQSFYREGFWRKLWYNISHGGIS